MGEVVSLVSGVVSVVSGVTQAVSARGQQTAASAAARQSVALAREQADADNQAAREDAANEEYAIRQDLNAVLASQRAIMGASGAEFDSPTNAAIRAESEEQASRDVLQVRTNLGRTQASNERQVRAAQIGAESSVRAANAGALAAYGGAVGSLISGASRIYSYTQATAERDAIASERARQSARGRRS